MMKKSAIFRSIALIVFIMCSSAAFAKRPKITVIKHRPSPQGTYDNIREDHWTNPWHRPCHRLSCARPGVLECAWEFPPTGFTSPGGGPVDIDAIVANAELIASTSTATNGHVIQTDGVEYFWSFDSTNGLVIDIYPEGFDGADL